jgi:hypothetical protein
MREAEEDEKYLHESHENTPELSWLCWKEAIFEFGFSTGERTYLLSNVAF